MKLKKAKYYTKRQLTLLIHKDGSTVKMLLHSYSRIRLCFTDLDNYYSNLDILSSNMVYYNEIMDMMINSIYDEAIKKYKMIHNKEIILDFGTK
jgi:hypothetical protein